MIGSYGLKRPLNGSWRRLLIDRYLRVLEAGSMWHGSNILLVIL